MDSNNDIESFSCIICINYNDVDVSKLLVAVQPLGKGLRGNLCNITR